MLFQEGRRFNRKTTIFADWNKLRPSPHVRGYLNTNTSPPPPHPHPPPFKKKKNLCPHENTYTGCHVHARATGGDRTSTVRWKCRLPCVWRAEMLRWHFVLRNSHVHVHRAEMNKLFVFTTEHTEWTTDLHFLLFYIVYMWRTLPLLELRTA